MKKIILTAFVAAFLYACSKDVGDAAAPKINLASPANQQTFAAGQVATVAATITDDNEVHQVHLYVANKATGAELVHFEEHTDLKTYNLQKTFTVQEGVAYTIKLEATDHAENKSEVKIEVSGK